MSIETKLTGISLGVDPLYADSEETGRQINFYHEPSDTYYLVPLSLEGATALAELLAMDTEALVKKNEENKK